MNITSGSAGAEVPIRTNSAKVNWIGSLCMRCRSTTRQAMDSVDIPPELGSLFPFPTLSDQRGWVLISNIYIVYHTHMALGT